MASGSNSTSRSTSLSGRSVPFSVEPNSDSRRMRRGAGKGRQGDPGVSENSGAMVLLLGRLRRGRRMRACANWRMWSETFRSFAVRDHQRASTKWRPLCGRDESMRALVLLTLAGVLSRRVARRPASSPGGNAGRAAQATHPRQAQTRPSAATAGAAAGGGEEARASAIWSARTTSSRCSPVRSPR